MGIDGDGNDAAMDDEDMDASDLIDSYLNEGADGDGEEGAEGDAAEDVAMEGSDGHQHTHVPGIASARAAPLPAQSVLATGHVPSNVCRDFARGQCYRQSCRYSHATESGTATSFSSEALQQKPIRAVIASAKGQPVPAKHPAVTVAKAALGPRPPAMPPPGHPGHRPPQSQQQWRPYSDHTAHAQPPPPPPNPHVPKHVPAQRVVVVRPANQTGGYARPAPPPPAVNVFSPQRPPLQPPPRPATPHQPRPPAHPPQPHLLVPPASSPRPPATPPPPQALQTAVTAQGGEDLVMEAEALMYQKGQTDQDWEDTNAYQDKHGFSDIVLAGLRLLQVADLRRFLQDKPFGVYLSKLPTGNRDDAVMSKIRAIDASAAEWARAIEEADTGAHDEHQAEPRQQANSKQAQTRGDVMGLRPVTPPRGAKSSAQRQAEKDSAAAAKVARSAAAAAAADAKDRSRTPAGRKNSSSKAAQQTAGAGNQAGPQPPPGPPPGKGKAAGKNTAGIGARTRKQQSTPPRQPKQAAPAAEEQESTAISDWLQSFDTEGVLNKYLPALKKEFNSLSEVRAAQVSQPGAKKSALACIEPSVFKVLGITSLGHKLLLAKGIVALSGQEG
eukprot:TRINITY_DN11576_c0_g1_i1.p1 TRINITY_DN11576_c0_g1~~TRINITY_DN11576_c0_g1_i1.p1  ORF type:complete len:613 (+),score=130.48 TRINITY_DN11576_c0_g1_i1:138-1976(+)